MLRQESESSRSLPQGSEIQMVEALPSASGRAKLVEPTLRLDGWKWHVLINNVTGGTCLGGATFHSASDSKYYRLAIVPQVKRSAPFPVQRMKLPHSLFQL